MSRLGALLLVSLLGIFQLSQALVTPVSSGDVSVRYVRHSNGTVVPQTIYSYTFLCPTGESEQYMSPNAGNNTLFNVVINCNDIVYTNRMLLRTWTPRNSTVITVTSAAEAKILNADPSKLMTDRYLDGVITSTQSRKRFLDPISLILGIVTAVGTFDDPSKPSEEEVDSLAGTDFAACQSIIGNSFGKAGLSGCLYKIVSIMSTYEARFNKIQEQFAQMQTTMSDIAQQARVLQGITVTLQEENRQTRSDVKRVIQMVGANTEATDMNQRQIDLASQQLQQFAVTTNQNNQLISESIARVQQQASDMATTTFMDLSNSIQNLAADTSLEIARLTQTVYQSIARLQSNIDQLQTNQNIQQRNAIHQQQSVNENLLGRIAAIVNTQNNILTTLSAVQNSLTDLTTLMISNGYATLDVHYAYQYVRERLGQVPFVKDEGIPPANLSEWKIIGARIMNISAYTFYDKNQRNDGEGCESVLFNDNWLTQMRSYYANKDVEWRVPRLLNRYYAQYGDMVLIQARQDNSTSWKYVSSSCVGGVLTGCATCADPDNDQRLCLRDSVVSAMPFRFIPAQYYSNESSIYTGPKTLVGMGTSFVLLGQGGFEGTHFRVPGESGGMCLTSSTDPEILTVVFPGVTPEEITETVSSVSDIVFIRTNRTYLTVTGNCVDASLDYGSTRWRIVPYFGPATGMRRRSVDDDDEEEVEPVPEQRQSPLSAQSIKPKREVTSDSSASSTRQTRALENGCWVGAMGSAFWSTDYYANSFTAGSQSTFDFYHTMPGGPETMEPAIYDGVGGFDGVLGIRNACKGTDETASCAARWCSSRGPTCVGIVTDAPTYVELGTNKIYPGMYQTTISNSGGVKQFQYNGVTVGCVGVTGTCPGWDFLRLPQGMSFTIIVTWDNGVVSRRQFRNRYLPLLMWNMGHGGVSEGSVHIQVVHIMVDSAQRTAKDWQYVDCINDPQMATFNQKCGIALGGQYDLTLTAPLIASCWRAGDDFDYPFVRYDNQQIVCDINQVSIFGWGSYGSIGDDPSMKPPTQQFELNMDHITYTTFVDSCSADCMSIRDRGTCNQATDNRCIWAFNQYTKTSACVGRTNETDCSFLTPTLSGCIIDPVANGQRYSSCALGRGSSPKCTNFDEFTSIVSARTPCAMRLTNSDTSAACIDTVASDVDTSEDLMNGQGLNKYCMYFRSSPTAKGVCAYFNGGAELAPGKASVAIVYPSDMGSPTSPFRKTVWCATPGAQCVIGPTVKLDMDAYIQAHNTYECSAYDAYPDECTHKAGDRCEFRNNQCTPKCFSYTTPLACVQAPHYGKCMWIRSTETCIDNTVDMPQRTECASSPKNCATIREVCNLFDSPVADPTDTRLSDMFYESGFEDAPDKDWGTWASTGALGTGAYWPGGGLVRRINGTMEFQRTNNATGPFGFTLIFGADQLAQPRNISSVTMKVYPAGEYRVRVYESDNIHPIYTNIPTQTGTVLTFTFPRVDRPVSFSIQAMTYTQWSLDYIRVGQDEGSPCSTYPECTWITFDPELNKNATCELKTRLVYPACFDSNKEPLDRCDAGMGHDVSATVNQLKNECTIDTALTGEDAIRTCVLSVDSSTSQPCVYAEITGAGQGSCYMPGSAALNAIQDASINPIGVTVWTFASYMDKRSIKDDVVTTSLNFLIENILRPEYQTLMIDNVRYTGLQTTTDTLEALWPCPTNMTNIGRFCCPDDQVYTSFTGNKLCKNETMTLPNLEHPFYRFVNVSQTLCQAEGAVEWTEPKDVVFPIYYMCKIVLVPGDEGYTEDAAFCPSKTNNTGSGTGTYRCYPFIEADICNDLSICARMGSLECSVEVQPKPEVPPIRVVRLTPESMDALSSFLTFDIYNGTQFRLSDIDAISGNLYEQAQDVFKTNLTDSPIDLIADLIAVDLMNILTTKKAVYGENPTLWDATPGEGIRARRGPPQVINGKYVVKTDEYVFASISEEMLPIYEYRFGQYQTNPTMNVTGGEFGGVYTASAVAIIDDFSHENPQDGDLFMFEEVDGLIISPPSSMMSLSGNAISRCGLIPYLHSGSPFSQAVSYDTFVEQNVNWDPECFHIHPQIYASFKASYSDPDDPDYCGEFYLSLDNTTDFVTTVGIDLLRAWNFTDYSGTPLYIWWNQTVSNTSFPVLQQFTDNVRQRWKDVGCPSAFQNFIDVTKYDPNERVGLDFLREIWQQYISLIGGGMTPDQAMDSLEGDWIQPQYLLRNNVYCGNCGLGYTTRCLLKKRVVQPESDNSARKGACARSRHKILRWDKETGIMRAIARSSTARMLVTFESPTPLDLNLVVNTDCPPASELKFNCPPGSSLCVMRAVNPNNMAEGSIVIGIEVTSEVCPSLQQFQIPPGGVINPTIPLCDGDLQIRVYNFDRSQLCYDSGLITVNITASFESLLDSQINNTFQSVVQTYVVNSMAALNSQLEITIREANDRVLADIERINSTLDGVSEIFTDWTDMKPTFNNLLATQSVHADVISHLETNLTSLAPHLEQLQGITDTMINASISNQVLIDQTRQDLVTVTQHIDNMTAVYDTILNANHENLNELTDSVSEGFNNMTRLAEEFKNISGVLILDKKAGVEMFNALLSPGAIAGYVIASILLVFSVIGAAAAFYLIHQYRMARKQRAVMAAVTGGSSATLPPGTTAQRMYRKLA